MTPETATTAPPQPVEPPAPGPPNLHRSPPFGPATTFGPPGRLALLLGAALAALACGAAYDDARLLLVVDEPVQRFVESHRHGVLTRPFTWLTGLGHQNAIIPATIGLTALTWRRCRIASLLIIAVTAGRIVLHLALKDGIARDRPGLDPVVSAVGNSFPSGHVMSAVIIWGLLPFVVGLVTDRRRIWWIAAAVAGGIMVTSTVSRFYLGVHWFSDSVAGLLSGWLFLIGIHAAVNRHHQGLPVLPGRAGAVVGRWAGPPTACR